MKKKKGIVRGVLGFILSLILAAGALVYTSMFDVLGAAKVGNPVGGSSTGNVFTAYLGKETFTESHTLIDDAYAAIGNSSASKYKSFTLEYSYSGEAVLDGTADSISSATEKGMIWADEKLIYIRANCFASEGKTTRQVSIALVINRANGDFWSAKDLDAQNILSPVLPESVVWEKGLGVSGVYGSQIMLFFTQAFDNVKADSKKFDYLSGMSKFAATMGADQTGDVSYTVGTRPTFVLNLAKEGTVSGQKIVQFACVKLSFSHLNQTTVVCPDGIEM